MDGADPRLLSSAGGFPETTSVPPEQSVWNVSLASLNSCLGLGGSSFFFVPRNFFFLEKLTDRRGDDLPERRMAWV